MDRGEPDRWVSMIALHGLWTTSSLCLWGESRAALAESPTPAATGLPADIQVRALHPLALPADALRQLVGDRWEGLLAAGAADATVTLRLPSTDDEPCLSPHIADSLTPAAPSSQPELRSWAVPCLRFAPADAIDLLTSLPAQLADQVAIGSSLQYWARLARIVVELLAAERFVPDVIELSDGRHLAQWRALLNEQDHTRRLAALISAMPPVCRCAETGHDSPQSAAIVEDFLHATTDSMIRLSLAGDPLVQSLQQGEDAGDPFEVNWLRALVGQDPSVCGPYEKRAELARQVRLWVGQLEDTAGHAHFRTCFRLEPPSSPLYEADEEEWTVTIHMQATDDSAVTLDASRIWTARRRGLALLRRQYELLAEQLEADLRKASHLFEPLADLLDDAEPSSFTLDGDWAYTFLREAAPLLELNGFGVTLPDWWTRPEQRLGLRLQIEPAASPAGHAPNLGLDALVDYKWQVAVGDELLSDREFRSICERGRSLVRLRGRWIEAPAEAMRLATRFLGQQPQGQVSVFEALRLSVGDTGQTGLPVIGLDATGWIRAALNSVGTDDQTITDLTQPERFNGALRPYQLKGLSWIAFLDRYGLGGCLADDMGLGKTIQLIALLLHERQNGASPGPTLLIVPMSLVGNWRRELQRFSPNLRAMIHHGTQRLSGETFVDEVARHDVVISTYALAYRDLDHLARVHWYRVALDEAQNIKNPSAKQTAAIRQLRCRRRLGLTGTPLENHLSELWSIMEFLNPGLLGNATEFRREFAVPIEKHHEADRAERLRRLIRPFVLRRRKDDPSVIVDLPEKMEMKVFCNLTREQAALYQSVVDDMFGDIELSSGIRRRGLVLAALTRLKQVCNHPRLVFESAPHAASLTERSGKCDRLVEMLEEVLAEGERALVFTQFRKMGDLLHPHLQERLGCGVLFLHGQTSQPQREEMVERFQSDDPSVPIFLLSLKAGGFGLNLTSANHVFHYDRWWNPAVEDQASDRAHRIGQRKTVQVHKFVCIGTLEERIDRMLEEKRDLADRIIGSGEKWLTELSTQDLREVLSLTQDAVAED